MTVKCRDLENPVHQLLKMPVPVDDSNRTVSLNCHARELVFANISGMKTCESHRVKGWFFVPEAPDNRIPGILTWTQENGADLELIGGLSRQPVRQHIDEGVRLADQFTDDTSPSTIYGELDSGKKICLWGAERGNYKTSVGNKVWEEFWHASWVCVGAHVASADTQVLRNFRVALDNLYYLTDDGRFCAPLWASIEGVENPGERQEDGTYLLPFMLPVVGGYRAGYAKGSSAGTTYSIDTHATRPWVSQATEADPALKLQLMTNRRRRGPSIELSVGAHVGIALVDDSAASAEELLHRARPLLGLMSLAMFDTSGVEWMEAQTVNGDEVSLLCHMGHPSEPSVRTEAGGVVFTLDDVSLDVFLETWHRLASGEQAQYAWNLVVGLIGHSPLMVEEHVSQVLAAAEGFDTWCLVGGTNTGLKKRLINLHGRLSERLRNQLQLDVDRWADWAVWARNHVAHGGTKKHRDISDFYQLKVIADSVRLVTYLAVLQEFQVPDDKLTQALSSHPRLKVLTERCAEIPDLPAFDA